MFTDPGLPPLRGEKSHRFIKERHEPSWGKSDLELTPLLATQQYLLVVVGSHYFDVVCKKRTPLGLSYVRGIRLHAFVPPPPLTVEARQPASLCRLTLSPMRLLTIERQQDVDFGQGVREGPVPLHLSWSKFPHEAYTGHGDMVIDGKVGIAKVPSPWAGRGREGEKGRQTELDLQQQ